MTGKFENTFSYASFDAALFSSEDVDVNMCSLSIAKMINKAGHEVEVSADSIETALRSGADRLTAEEHDCPGF
eukprot:3934331-Rhodomonas_salina.1